VRNASLIQKNLPQNRRQSIINITEEKEEKEDKTGKDNQEMGKYFIYIKNNMNIEELRVRNLGEKKNCILNLQMRKEKFPMTFKIKKA
jgi:hypothetical protein